MMNLRPLHETEEHATLRAQVRRFAEREIAPFAHAWEEANEFPRELYRKAASAGILGRTPLEVALWARAGERARVIALGPENMGYEPVSAVARGKDPSGPRDARRGPSGTARG